MAVAVDNRMARETALQPGRRAVDEDVAARQVQPQIGGGRRRPAAPGGFSKPPPLKDAREGLADDAGAANVCYLFNCTTWRLRFFRSGTFW